jgi:predicted O-methyltransferase YrrM
MLPEQVSQHLGSLPYMRVEQARVFYDLITHNRLTNCLELGFFHGVSTAYIAGAIQDLQHGHLATIDLTTASAREPNIEWVLSKTGLRHLVTIHLEPRSFNWRLMRMLEEGQFETFDFCYLDGGHTWYDTGLGFCLVERLLKPGGWAVFDDLHFTFRESSNFDKPWVRRMPEEEQTEPQVQRVFELLVETNPNFGDFRRMGQFGFARKRKSSCARPMRESNQAEAIVARALEAARTDLELRNGLLTSPAPTLSKFSVRPQDDFAHFLFEESESLGPLPSETSEHGSTIVYMERVEAANVEAHSDLPEPSRKTA